MRSIISFTLVSFTLVLSSAYCQDSTAPLIKVEFKIPKGWRKFNDSVYILKNFDKDFTRSHKSLAQGHMPWRSDPKNVAAACFWSFGITDNTFAWDFATRFTELKKDQTYSLLVDSTSYIVHVRTKQQVPIPYKFEVKRRKSLGAG